MTQRTPRVRPILTLALGLLLGAAHADGPLSPRDALIHDYVTANHGTVPLSRATRGVHDITLEIHEITTELSPGVKVTQWAFALPGQAPSVPGPELHVRVGEHVRITFRNTHTQPHAIHLHGITSLAQEMDGVPHTSHEVLPGQSFTYEFVATEAGTHAYHCHFQTNVHLDMGMYGALIVDPPEGTKEPWTKEHTLVLDEWDSRQDPGAATHDAHPDLFLVNGRTFPLIPDVNVPKGETHLLRMINLGSEPHSMHLHGNDFLVIAKDGHDLPLPYRADTLPILPGERYDLLVTGRDGAFPFHDHNTSENTNRGVYPGGMHFLVTGSPALKADGTPDLTSPAGHDHAGMTGMTTPPATTPAATTPAVVTPPTPAHDHAQADPAADGTASADATVVISNFAYAPAVASVKRGGTVVFENRDKVQHVLVLNVDGREERRTLAAGGRTRVTVGEKDVTYFCQPHPFMKGRVTVR